MTNCPSSHLILRNNTRDGPGGDGNAALTVIATLTATESELFEERVTTRVIERLERGDASPWMGVDRAAEYLGWPKKRLYNLTVKKEVPHRKQGNRLLFNREELDRWLADYYEGPPTLRP
jgi:excisionase family DNA binding protein